MPDTSHPSVLQGGLKRSFEEQVSFFRAKLGNLVPTERWDDLRKSEHDRGFMVAGAAKADLLTDLGAAVDRAIAEGKSLQSFRKDFASIVQRHGWTDYTGEFGWRTRIILTTNAATSYAAGRLAQLRAGGFDRWVYRHSDAVAQPRFEHQAWNGLTLAPEHPFWQTHYPPSAWGCRCYVVGARDDAGAKRLGGEPDKPLPEGWDGIDAKIGEPPGIGKGWGYMPGATVVDTVRQMAAKTQAWDYSVAKAYMQGVPESVRDALTRSYRSLPSVANDTRLYAQRILEGRTHLDIPPYRTLGLLTSDDVRQISALVGTDVAGYDFALDRHAVAHIRTEHGTALVEAQRGQRAVVAADYAKLPQILNGGEIAHIGQSAVGHPVVRIFREIDGEGYAAVFEVRAGRKMLALQSLWIRSGTPPR